MKKSDVIAFPGLSSILDSISTDKTALAVASIYAHQLDIE